MGTARRRNTSGSGLEHLTERTDPLLTSGVTPSESALHGAHEVRSLEPKAAHAGFREPVNIPAHGFTQMGLRSQVRVGRPG